VFNTSETFNVAISNAGTYTSDFFHVISQILLIPVVVGVIIFFFYSIISSGIL